MEEVSGRNYTNIKLQTGVCGWQAVITDCTTLSLAADKDIDLY